MNADFKCIQNKNNDTPFMRGKNHHGDTEGSNEDPQVAPCCVHTEHP
jgi:hypothetical protein